VVILQRFLLGGLSSEAPAFEIHDPYLVSRSRRTRARRRRDMASRTPKPRAKPTTRHMR